MTRVAVLYATSEGHTRTVAFRVVERLARLDVVAEAHDVGSPDALVALDASEAVILASSIHVGAHQPQFVAFVKQNRELLDARPTLLLQVSLTARAHGDEAHQQIEGFEKAFEEAAGWHPGRWEPVAGAVPYRQVGPLKRWFMRFVMGRVGGPTDTSVDHVFTDWDALDAAIARFAEEVGVISAA
jgi:menaquinone-dependent protoporphyrinogen oxidase